MTLTLSYRLPRTSQKQTQQEAVLAAVQLAPNGELQSELLPLQETNRTVVTIGTEVQIAVELTALPGFTDLYPTTAAQEAAVNNLFLATLQALTYNRARQHSVVIVP